jgi:hypothetical protein
VTSWSAEAASMSEVELERGTDRGEYSVRNTAATRRQSKYNNDVITLNFVCYSSSKEIEKVKQN